MIRLSLFFACCAILQPTQAAPVFGPLVDLSQFSVTFFASGLSLPQGMVRLSDGSILVQQSPGFIGGELIRITDTNADGIGIIDPSPLYSNPNGQGPLTQLVTAGDYILEGTFGDKTITLLKTGSDPGAAITYTAALQFDYPDGW